LVPILVPNSVSSAQYETLNDAKHVA
jgi:hypothetical protein